MRSILIKGMKMPKSCDDCIFVQPGGKHWCYIAEKDLPCDCPLVELPDHGDLIDRDAFRKTMYHDTFETDSDLQKWESGCWIRYKMFERNIKSAPVVIPAERNE